MAFGKQHPRYDLDDITCANCGLPLLSLKTVCPKCGGSAANPVNHTAPQPSMADPVSNYALPAASNSGPFGSLIEMGLLAVAVLGFFFAVINPLLGMVAPVDLFRSFEALATSMALLGLRQLLIR